MTEDLTYTAFAGEKMIASGTLQTMLPEVKERFDRSNHALFSIFEDQTGKQVDFDFRGTLAEVLAHASPARPRSGAGRPKLGVVSREISLLPRHWTWLEKQPSGASAA